MFKNSKAEVKLVSDKAVLKGFLVLENLKGEYNPILAVKEDGLFYVMSSGFEVVEHTGVFFPFLTRHNTICEIAMKAAQSWCKEKNEYLAQVKASQQQSESNDE